LKYPKVDVLTFGDTGIDGEIVIDIKFLRKFNSLHQDDQEILTVPQEDIQSDKDSVPFTRIKQVSV
jgi:predicted aspartyl protease